MKNVSELARGRRAIVPTLRLWLVFLLAAGAAALLIAALQRLDAALSVSPPRTTPQASAPASAVSVNTGLPRTAFAPTFADAAESLRAGRFAEAYGRWVTLADEGDVDAARIALVMHRFGPTVFGSQWDASVEQLAEWTRWSEAAAAKDLARLRAMARGRPVGPSTGTHDTRPPDARSPR